MSFLPMIISFLALIVSFTSLYFSHLRKKHNFYITILNERDKNSLFVCIEEVNVEYMLWNSGDYNESIFDSRIFLSNSEIKLFNNEMQKKVPFESFKGSGPLIIKPGETQLVSLKINENHIKDFAATKFSTKDRKVEYRKDYNILSDQKVYVWIYLEIKIVSKTGQIQKKYFPLIRAESSGPNFPKQFSEHLCLRYTNDKNLYVINKQ